MKHTCSTVAVFIFSASKLLENGAWNVALSGYLCFLRRKNGERKLRRRPQPIVEDAADGLVPVPLCTLLAVWPIWKKYRYI